MKSSSENTKKTHIISAVGYYYTGSGIIEDLCKEFDDCEILGDDFEVRLLQDPDGISDLQYYVVDNNHRHNTGFGIKRFLRYAKFLNGEFFAKRYRKVFGEDFLRITQKYVDSIVQQKATTWWHADQIQKGKLFYLIDALYGRLTVKIKGQRHSLLEGKEKNYFTYLSLDEFIEKTRSYTTELFSQAKKTERDFLFVNQVVPPSNIDRFINYFEDMKVVIVERDPRDLYIASKEQLKEGVIPDDNVNDFCKWYRITRRHRKLEHRDETKSIFVNMEDLIYKYNDTVNSVIEFLGLDKNKHTYKKKYFDPDISIRGTQLIKRYPQYSEDISIIEKELSEYIYKY